MQISRMQLQCETFHSQSRDSILSRIIFTCIFVHVSAQKQPRNVRRTQYAVKCTFSFIQCYTNVNYSKSNKSTWRMFNTTSTTLYSRTNPHTRMNHCESSEGENIKFSWDGNGKISRRYRVFANISDFTLVVS